MHVRVKVSAGARREEIIRKGDDHYAIAVKEKAERNLANQRILEILRGLYPGQAVRMAKGHHQPAKIFEID